MEHPPPVIDSGGQLPSGLTVVVNRTGQAEPLIRLGEGA